MSERPLPAHVVTPLTSDTPGIEVANREPAHWMIEVEFDPEEVKRLRAGYTRGPEGITRFIKRAALELADREARRKAEEQLRESA